MRGIYMCPKCWGEEFSPGNCKYDGTPLVLKDGEESVLGLAGISKKTKKFLDEFCRKNPDVFNKENGLGQLLDLEDMMIRMIAAREKEVRREERERIIEVIQKDNRADGMYSGLAQYTNGYDTATQRAINLIEALSPQSETKEGK